MRSGNREKILPMSVNSSEPDKSTEQKADGLPSAPMRRYSRAQLAQHDGSDPNLPVLIAYKSKVYDVTASYPWAKGSHWGITTQARTLHDVSKRQSRAKKCSCVCPVLANSIHEIPFC
jgi:predicted heme/steroid binding protein